ncbi:MAG: MFS transporter [Parvibaculaceae bacterium]|nr:MFS transporter [Parvibaculaceae bacterium]
MSIPVPLLALSVCAFGIGTTEFVPMGLLPLIATDLGVSIPKAGLLVSGYAMGVLIGAPLLTLTTGAIPRKALLIGLMGLFILGNLMTALATSYDMLLAARVLTSMCHGTFFGVGSVVAASLVPPQKRAGAISAMFTGLTLANFIGVPLGTWFGHEMGWRATFWVVTGLGLVAAAGLQLTLPHLPAPEDVDMRRETAVLARPAVLLALLTTVLSSGAMFTVFTYIAPILTQVTGVSPAFITGALVIYGIGLTVGNSLGGHFADRSLHGTLIVVLGSLTLLLVLFAFTMSWPLPALATIFAWGVATFAVVSPLQIRVMLAAHDAPNLASSMNIGAFNLGNAIGAALGGAVIADGHSYQTVSIAAALLALSSLVLVLASVRRPRQRKLCEEC